MFKLLDVSWYLCRFIIKAEVYDGEEAATFVMFDTDGESIIRKSCKDLVLGSKVHVSV